MHSEDEFCQRIIKHDQLKLWHKKLGMLKKGLHDQRRCKQKVMADMEEKKQLLQKLEAEIEWKNRLNEALNKEIKGTKDEILEQRNNKRRLRDQLTALEDPEDGPDTKAAQLPKNGKRA